MGNDPSGHAGVPTGVPASLSGTSSGELTGRELGGFALKELIGAGGYGDVYLAEQIGLKREAIVKVLRPDGINEDRIQRFLREAQLASRLDHPFAAHIYAFGTEADGVFWIAMEHVRGASLRAVLEAQGPMSLERFVPLLERVCDVVHTAHEQGIVHRDLKPDNVMVISRAGKLMPKLLDFGIARAIESDAPAQQTAASAGAMSAPVTTATQRGGVLGSPSYMAPEVWVDPHSAGPAADQYALGALAYEALSGRIAFDGKTVIEVARAHSRGKIEPLGDGFTPELEAAIRRSLSRKAADRFGNVLELAQALRSASGIGEIATDLPQLDEELRVAYLSTAPQPLADAVAAYDAAKNAHQARAALRGIARAAATYVGIVALACRTRVGSGGAGDSDHAQKLLRDLRRHGLAPGDWIELARQLTQPFARLPDTYPVPELALLLHRATGGIDPFAPLLAGSLVESLAESSLDAVTQSVARELPAVTALLRALQFLVDYPLVVPREAGAEAWMGTRGGAHKTIVLRRDVPLEHPLLADASGSPIVSLWPLVQVHAAVPGHNEELFLLAGPGRTGARLVSSPHGFEHADPTLWDWYREQLFRTDEPPSEAAADAAPYRGLSSYRQGDAQWFFGREREAESLGNRLKLEAFVAVVGPSGVGKSSFVHAGLAPSLEGWRVVTARPQRAPFEQLGAALGIADLHTAAAADLTAAAERIRALATASTGLLIVIDQFEETITLASSPAERDLFAKLLLAITRSPEHPLRVVITLRDDFLIRAEQLPGFDRALASGLQLLGPLGPAALEKILVEPARRAGYEFEDATMPARMIAEVAGTPAAVALISFTANRLWELRDRHFYQLPKKAYEAIGGVGGALAQHADDTVEAMPAAERGLVRKAFRHLVTFEGTRAVLGRDELAQLLGGGTDAERAIERLIEARLVSASEGEDGQPVVEIVHEALLSAWPRLAEWRREDVEGSRFHEQLRAAAKQWHDRGRPRGALWRGDALAEYQLWRRRNPQDLTPIESAFGNASVASETRGRRIRRSLLAVAMVAIAVFVTVLWRATLTARTERNAATVSRQAAETMARDATFEQGRLIALQGDKLGSLSHLKKAYDMGETGPAIRFLIEESLRPTRGKAALLDGHASVNALTYGRNGTRIATTGDDGTIRLWDAASGAPLAVLQANGHVANAVFSPDGKQLATGGRALTVDLWDVDTYRHLASLPFDSPIQTLAFSADGALLVATGRQGTVNLWRMPSREPLGALPGHHDETNAAFCGDDSLATWDAEGRAVVWDSHTLKARRHHGFAPGINAGFVDRKCKTLALGTKTGDVILWREDGSIVSKPRMHAGEILDIAISPDGETVATAGADGTAVLSDVAGDRRVVLRGHRAGVAALAFSPDGSLLATAGADKTARLWRVPSGATIAELSGHENYVVSLAFRPDGKQLATASWDHHAIVWNIAGASEFSPVETARFTPEDSRVKTAFSPDGERLGLATEDGFLIVSKSNNVVCRGRSGAPTSLITWSLDGEHLATVGEEDRVVRTWNGRSCEIESQLTHPDVAYAVAFGPNGTLATGGGDRTLRIWNLATGQIEKAFTDYPGVIIQVGFHPDGKRLFALTLGRIAVVLEALEPNQPRRVLEAGQKGVTAIELDRLRHRVLVSGLDQYLWVWNDDTGELIDKLEGSGPLWSVRISSDGALIVGVGGVSPPVWDARTLRRLGTLVGHTDQVESGEFIDSRLFVTGSLDDTVMVWDLSTMRPLDRLNGAQKVVIDAAMTSVVLSDPQQTRVWHPSFPSPNRKELQ